MSSLLDDDTRRILRRQELLTRHHPKCSWCNSDQVQLVGKLIPARWKCRRCKTVFTSEPGDK